MSEVYPAAALAEDVFRTLQPPARLAVFGDPIAHSRSPQMQNAALKACELEMQYVRIHATAAEFPAALRNLPEAGFVGANVTIPHKFAALETVDTVDEHAKKIGSVNTVLVENGKLKGFSTDGPGLVRAIREEFAADLRDLRVMLLGTGGAGRAIAVQCALENCQRLVLVNRTQEKAEALAQELSSHLPSERLEAIPWELSEIGDHIGEVDLLINATSLGMRPTDPPLLPKDLLPSGLMVYDTVYAAGKSRLIEDAESRGAKAANGLSMLLWQGALAFEIWFNRPAPVEAMRQGLLAL